jgi:hypothetical protein
MTLKKNLIIHPVLLAVYPVLFLYSHNIGQVRFGDAVGPVLVILAVTIAAWGLLRVLTRSWHKSAMITSFFLLLFFSYEHIRALLGTKESILLAMFWLFILAATVATWAFLRVLIQSRYWSSMITSFFLILFFSYGYEHVRALVGARISIFLSLVWLSLFLGGSFHIIRTRKPLAKATTILNVFAAVLVALTLANIAIYKLAAAGQATQEDIDFDVRVSSGQSPQSDAYPDIYFIILDAYARQDVLGEIYNFDNSDFIKFLRDRGFYVADKCAANYCQTGLSVGSCLNLAYLDNLVKILGPDYIDRRPLGAIIKESRVHKFLKEHGYKTVGFATHEPITNLRGADFYLKSGTMVNVFHNSIINATPLPDIIKLKKEPSDFDTYRHNILYIFDNIVKVPKMCTGPKFVFAHIEIPHSPFVFGPNGEPVSMESRLSFDDADWLIRPGRFSHAQYRKAYCDQIRFVNSRMKKVIDEILSNSSRPPIILILGDHGPRSGVIWEDPERTNAKECLSNLGAFHLPGGGEELLYPDMTLVNLFRVIFNRYFGEKLELLPDRCYFSTARYLYRFYDVTDRVREVYKGHPADSD